jgi:hypothetical protein
MNKLLIELYKPTKEAEHVLFMSCIFLVSVDQIGLEEASALVLDNTVPRQV